MDVATTFIDWIGRQRDTSDTITVAPVRGLEATLDYPSRDWMHGDAVPLLAHWLYLLDVAPRHELGDDGHPQRGGFLPPVPFPRRMWAGSSLEFHKPLCVGDAITRTSTILDVAEKNGRTGPLVFVKVRHEIRRDGEVDAALTEVQDIVYREAPGPDEPAPADKAAPDNATWERKWLPDEALLFRFSALTFNGHRIHYDRRYAIEAERYPALVVHGPLIATLVLNLLRDKRPDAQVVRYEFRAVRPLFDSHHFFVCGQAQPDGKTFHLWAKDHEGRLAMDATAWIR